MMSDWRQFWQAQREQVEELAVMDDGVTDILRAIRNLAPFGLIAASRARRRRRDRAESGRRGTWGEVESKSKTSL